MEWIDVEKELPACDGFYQVTNFPENESNSGVCCYDGYGFKFDGHYGMVKFWRNTRKIVKKYGKIKLDYDPLPACFGSSFQLYQNE